MTTRFSKAKLVKAQEKKAKTSLSGGLLSRKHKRENEPSKDDVMVTSLVAKFQVRRPASPTSSLELIVLGEFLHIFEKYLDYDKKLIEAQSGIASLSTENKSLTIQISTLANEAKKDKDHLKTLEKNINTEKEFLKLKDEKIDEALMKEILEDHPFDTAVEDEVMPDLAGSIPTNEVVPDVTKSVLTNPSPSSLP
nr:hypothetical protein CFP56_42416 [Quercus suber]